MKAILVVIRSGQMTKYEYKNTEKAEISHYKMQPTLDDKRNSNIKANEHVPITHTLFICRNEFHFSEVYRSLNSLVRMQSE